MTEPRSHFYDSQRLKLHYVEWGTPGGRPLILLHGGRDHARSWDWVAQALGEGYHIVAPELRGHGDSDWAIGSSYPMADSIYDLRRLFAHLGWKSAPIVAHSLGGVITMHFTGAFPELVERLVVIEGWRFSTRSDFLGKGPAVEARIRKWTEKIDTISARQARRYPTLDVAVARMQEANPRLTHEKAEHLTVHGIKENSDGTYSWKYDNHIRTIAPYRFDATETERLWSLIACPTLLISGSEGIAAGTDDVLKSVPRAKSVTLDGAGHWPHHDQLDAFVSLVREFLDER